VKIWLTAHNAKKYGRDSHTVARRGLTKLRDSAAAEWIQRALAMDSNTMQETKWREAKEEAQV
jgi:hypothetical protein